MNDVTFVKGEGGLGRTLPQKSQYSGMLFYNDTKPAGFDTNIKEITSLSAAEALGITSDNADDLIKVIHYHIEQFFAIYDYLAATPKLFVTIADVPAGTYDFTELAALQTFANGELMQIGIFVNLAYTTALHAAAQAEAIVLEGVHKPCSLILNFDWSATADWTAVQDLRSLTNFKCLVSIGQDGGGDGATLWDDGDLGFSVGDLGAILGWASVKNLNECIGWVKKFNLAFAGEFDTPALANGDLVSENEDLLDGLNTKGYVLMKKHIGISGTYFNDSHMSCGLTSDYAYLENNQVIDYAIRGIRTYLLPELNGNVSIDPDTGKIAPESISFYESVAARALNEMQANGFIDGASVYIDPDQDVLSTSILVINVKIVINGVARNIKVNIGFTKSL